MKTILASILAVALLAASPVFAADAPPAGDKGDMKKGDKAAKGDKKKDDKKKDDTAKSGGGGW